MFNTLNLQYSCHLMVIDGEIECNGNVACEVDKITRVYLLCTHRHTHTLTSSSADSTDSHEYLEYRPDRENDSVGVASLQRLLADCEQLCAFGVVQSDLSSSILLKYRSVFSMYASAKGSSALSGRGNPSGRV